jgi:DNA-binding Xre family transcriptional regulator
MSLAGTLMARKRTMKPGDPADGPILVQNLCRLGYCEQVVRTTEISRLVAEKTGKSMSRQRIANLLNAAHITDTTLATLAEALGVKPEDLLKK